MLLLNQFIKETYGHIKSIQGLNSLSTDNGCKYLFLFY